MEKIKITLLASLLLMFFFSQNALAHQPRIVEGDGIVVVRESEVSKAYYDVLDGKPAVFEIATERRFPLYVNILVPDTKESRTDFETRIEKIDSDGQSVTIAILSGSQTPWELFHEEFANDDYLKGPEFRMQMPKGTYRVIVSNPENQGAYALAIGEQESFPPSEIINTLVTVPKVKSLIFGKSPLTFLFSIVGLMVLLPAVLLIGIPFGIWKRKKIRELLTKIFLAAKDFYWKIKNKTQKK